MRSLIVISLVFGLLFSLSPEKIEAGSRAAQIKSPQIVAQRFFQAWRLKNRKAAAKVAAREAIEKLFGVRWRKMQFKGCNNRDEGGFECIYLDAKNDFSMAMIVEGGVSVGGYNVASVSFSSED